MHFLILLVALVDTIFGGTYMHTDTFRLQDQPAAADVETMEQLMLERMAAQAALLYNADSLREVARQDSIRREEEQLAIAKQQAQELAPQYTDTASRYVETVQKAIFRDAEEERQERMRQGRAFSPWYKDAQTLIQFSQSYVSSNWYQGGNSSFALLGILKGTIRYDNKSWVTWENTGEWRAGWNTVSGDSLRKMNVSDDMFRLYSKLGVKILQGKLYGTLTGEFATNLLPTYKLNSNQLKTGPFSPIRLNIGLGVDYTQVKNLSLVVSPFAYKFVYVMQPDRMSVKEHGIEEGSNYLSQVGSSVRVKYKWQPLREIALETEFYAYTNYHMIELDWEVICDFIVNRYITTRVMLHPRFDSSVVMEGDARAKMQFKELISIGFNHHFR